MFVKLFEKGLIYRDNYMVNWDPGMRSAISDLEVEQREVQDTLYMVDYPLESGSGSITVATVRPETMLADTAIAVNPDDERYTRLIGEAAILPLVGRRLPIIADEYVDPEFGTGALKITPGARPERLRDRPQAQARRAQRDRRGRPHDRRGRPRVRRHGGRGRARQGGRRAARGGRDLGHAAVRPRRAVLAPLGPPDRAADLAPVVLRHEGPGRAGDRRRARRPPALPPRSPAPRRLPQLAREHPPLVRVAPALVGSSAAGLVLRERRLRRDVRRHDRAVRSAASAAAA